MAIETEVNIGLLPPSQYFTLIKSILLLEYSFMTKNNSLTFTNISESATKTEMPKESDISMIDKMIKKKHFEHRTPLKPP